MLEYPLLFLFPFAMAYAAVSDLLTMTIPNRISLALVAGFVVLAPFAGLSWQTFGQHLAVGAAVLAVGIVLFSLRIFGGGDAKLIAAASLWLGLDQMTAFIGYVGVFGGLLCLAILLYRRVPLGIASLPAWALRLHDRRSGVPYGIAISAAALALYPKTPWYQAFAG